MYMRTYIYHALMRLIPTSQPHSNKHPLSPQSDHGRSLVPGTGDTWYIVTASHLKTLQCTTMPASTVCTPSPQFCSHRVCGSRECLDAPDIIQLSQSSPYLFQRFIQPVHAEAMRTKQLSCRKIACSLNTSGHNETELGQCCS